MIKKFKSTMCATVATVATAATVMTGVAQDDSLQQLGAAVNAQLEEAGLDFQLSTIETFTVNEAVGQTIYFNDRDFKTGRNFVPHDPRRGWSGDQTQWQDDITYAIDGVENQTHNGLNANPAIRRAMNTWDDVKSTTIPLTDGGDLPIDLGLFQFFTTGGASGLPGIVADITHAGFMPKEWFENVLGPGTGETVLAVTISFTYGSDIDGNGLVDSAFAEVYYNNNPAFNWAIDGQYVIGGTAPRDYDIQTVALHESGHGLSQNHFGKSFRTAPDGPVHFAPYAVMNAGYSRVQQTLTGTDLAGHSQLWANWPNN